MKKLTVYQTLNVILVAIAMVLMLPITLNAQAVETTKSPDIGVSNNNDATDENVVNEQNLSRETKLRNFRDKQSDVRQNIELKKEQREAKLEAKKLDICKKHEEKINSLMSRMSDRGNKRLEMFNKVVERIKLFYVEKGLLVENYDELLAVVDSARAVAEVAVSDTKSSSVNFKCDGTDPRGASLYFKEDLKNQNQAMKDYRSAIKNLLESVKISYDTSNPSNTQENQ